MPEERFYLTFSDDFRALLTKGNVDLTGAIKAELEKTPNVQARTSWEKNPTSTEDDREVVLLILAIGVSASLIAGAVSKIIDAKNRGVTATMREEHLTVALDGKGDPIRDKHGNPVYNSNKGIPTPPQGEASNTSLTYGKLLKFDVTTGAASKEK